jgi:DNA repair protein RecN (Recombination protein N)
MREAHRGMTALENLLPVATEAFDRMKKVTLEWDAIAKKHQVGRSDLQELRETWEEELTTMASIASTFPIALEIEKVAYQKYQDIAQKLTSLRSLAAKDLVIFLNEILPHLNMPENAILLVETPRKSPSATGSNDFAMISTATGSPVERVFSSGEMARLALAMEGSLVVSENETADISGSTEQCLLICDEIDAHVGGEASNAAARLLKRIGRTKQVIAITRKMYISHFTS